MSQSTHLNVSKTSFAIMYSRSNSQYLLLPFYKLSTRLLVSLDKELVINQEKRKKILSCFFSTKKIMHFSVFSPRYLSCPLNSFASCLIIKWLKIDFKSHSLTHCGKPMEFILVFWTFICRECVQPPYLSV